MVSDELLKSLGIKRPSKEDDPYGFILAELLQKSRDDEYREMMKNLGLKRGDKK